MRRALSLQAFLTGHPGKVSKKDSKKKPPAASKKDPEKTPLLPSRGYFFFQTILVCVVIISVVPGVGGVHLLRQPGNVWVTWANKTGQTDFCLSLQSATSPFRTCLIGIPQYSLNSFEGYVTNVTACNITDLANQTACLIQTLNTTLPWDPQELDILGSQMIKNGTTRTCVTFGSVCYKENSSTVCHNFDGNFNGTGGAEAELRDFIEKWKGADSLIRPYVNQSWTMVSPINTESFSISSRYCGFTSNETRWYYGENSSDWCSSKRGKWSAGYSNGTKCPGSNTTDCGGNCTAEWNYYAYGFTFGGQPEVLWNNRTAKALPPGIFLICGDRAWQGIPHNALGGPCYLGQLTMLSPNLTTWMTYGPNITGHRRSRRSASHLSPDCSDELQLWSATARIFASFFAPGVAAAQALREIERLACWSVKQANLTSLVLNAMLEDMNSIRHAVLQNRAAIDFLLLAQGHGCQDVEGMCCFNLSDHSESIHKALQAMKEHTEKIQVEDDPIGDWFARTFGEWGRWLAKGVKTLLFALLVIVCLLAIIPCIIKCFQDCLSRTMNQFMDDRIRYHRIMEQL